MASFRDETYFLESSDPYYVHPIVPSHGLRPIPYFKVYNLSRSEKGYDAFITWTSASGWLKKEYNTFVYDLFITEYIFRYTLLLQIRCIWCGY